MTAKPTNDQFARYHKGLTRRSFLGWVLDRFKRR